jgi:cohesin complex subunit SA-1/2
MTIRRMPLMEILENNATSTPGATGSRRKSGRAVKAPEKFDPGVLSSQHGSTSAKRKRGGEDVENGASDVGDEEEVSDEDVKDNVGEEEIRQSRKRPKSPKKPAAKKPKVNGTALHARAPAVRLPNRPKKARKVAIADGNAEGLYGKLV